ncbi:MAG TPA: FAD:protein FMN transferase [Candidatus Nanoarchaeia archaeon]|nr:FAD:protein FMN transferase [Candidatus Nanoarchaeia archaeon]
MGAIIKKPIMGGEIEFLLDDIEQSIGENIIKKTYKEALRLQKIFNFFDADSELSILNRERKIKASKELLEVILIALKYCEITKGQYDISLGKNILERKKGAELSKSKCSYKNIEIKKDIIQLTHQDALIDLGSIAKGYIVDKLAHFLKKQNVKSALIDSRGDIAIFGDKEKIFGIQHPRERNKILLKFKVKNCGIATSGDYNQFYGGFDKSHLINQKDLISVTVIAPTLMGADVMASAVFLLNKEEREILIRDNPEIKIYAVDKDLIGYDYNGFSEIIMRI